MRGSFLRLLVLAVAVTTIPCVAESQGYDRAAAVAYAGAWCSGRNPAYCDYGPSGGDCANFVSQALIAGGIGLGGPGCGGTIPGGGELSDRLRELGWESSYGCLHDPPANIRPGDVIQFYGDCERYVPGSTSHCNMGHSVIVVTIDGSSGVNIGCGSHTGDR